MSFLNETIKEMTLPNEENKKTLQKIIKINCNEIKTNAKEKLNSFNDITLHEKIISHLTNCNIKYEPLSLSDEINNESFIVDNYIFNVITNNKTNIKKYINKIKNEIFKIKKLLKNNERFNDEKFLNNAPSNIIEEKHKIIKKQQSDLDKKMKLYTKIIICEFHQNNNISWLVEHNRDNNYKDTKYDKKYFDFVYNEKIVKNELIEIYKEHLNLTMTI
jgi:hypothetical protein